MNTCGQGGCQKREKMLVDFVGSFFWEMKFTISESTSQCKEVILQSPSVHPTNCPDPNESTEVTAQDGMVAGSLTNGGYSSKRKTRRNFPWTASTTKLLDVTEGH